MTGQPMIVYFDFVCPYCLIAERTIEDAARDHGLGLEWRAFELRPFPTPTLRPDDDYLSTVWPRSVYPTARRHGVPVTLPTVSPQPYSHTAFEGMAYARRHGRQQAYNARVLRAFFQDDQDIGDIDVLVRVAVEVGLDGGDFRAALTGRRHATDHRAALAQAAADRITSVPTVLFGGYRLSGVPTRPQLDDLVRRASA